MEDDASAVRYVSSYEERTRTTKSVRQQHSALWSRGRPLRPT